MSDSGDVRILITAGDPNGIGPEVLIRALAQMSPFDRIQPSVIGSSSALGAAVEELSLPLVSHSPVGLKIGTNRVPIIDIGGTFVRTPGQMDGTGGAISARAVVDGVSTVLTGNADALVTMPISKEAWNLGGFHWPGHTELISSLCGDVEGLMILMCSEIRVALLTGHLPLAEVSRRIDDDLIVDRIHTFSESLSRDFGLARPRIALLALNPHAGDGGVLGNEEMTVYADALGRLQEMEIDVHGAYPADAFFARRRHRDFDGVMASYHDQGLVPMKLLAHGDGVNVTAGLPIVRTSPDHGTAFDIAGTGKASADSAVSAIRTAADIVRNRRTQPT